MTLTDRVGTIPIVVEEIGLLDMKALVKEIYYNAKYVAKYHPCFFGAVVALDITLLALGLYGLTVLMGW